MGLYLILAYIGAILVLLHFIFHLFQTVIEKKKVTPALWEMIVAGLVVPLLLLIYVIKTKDYPIIIFLAVTMFWAIAGLFDFLKS